MKNFLTTSAVILAAASFAAPAAAATTIGTDSTWKVGSSTTLAGASTLNPTISVRTPDNTEIPNSYARNNAGSAWISPDLGDGRSFNAGQGGSLPGFYNFSGKVNLVSLDSISSTLVRYWADNALVSVLVNGTQIFSANPASGAQQFVAGSGLTFNSNVAVWQLGANTINFIVRNDGTNSTGNPVALMAEISVPGSVPEPGTWMLMILGLGAVGFAMRRRQNATVRLQFA